MCPFTSNVIRLVRTSFVFLSLYLAEAANSIDYDKPSSPSTLRPRSGTSSRVDSSAELVLGTFPHELTYSWFYESGYPVLLKIPIPDWSTQGHRLNRSAPQCQNADLTPNYLCPIQYHMDNLLTPVSQNTRFFKNIYTDSPTTNDFYEKNFSCERIRPHFAHFATTLKGFQAYVDDFIGRCSLAKQITLMEKNISLSGSEHARMAFTKFTHLHKLAENKLEQLNINFTHLHQQEWKFLEMTTYASLQNSYTLSTYVDSIRWATAFSTCQSYRLDISLISPEMLTTLLEQVRQKLFQIGYKLSLPFEELLSHYYKLPLTDCALAIESASEAYLMLRMMIPVLKHDLDYKLFRLSKVPFYIRNMGTTESHTGSICEIKNYETDDLYLAGYEFTGEVATIMKAPSTCGPYHVCRIPDATHRNMPDACVESLLSGDQEGTKANCNFKCTPVPKNQSLYDFPLVTQLASNRYAITGAILNETNGHNVTVKCYGRVKLEAVKQERQDEATLITLPCPCEIAIGNMSNRRYFSQQPCNNTLEIIHVAHIVGQVNGEGNETGDSLEKAKGTGKHLDDDNIDEEEETVDDEIFSSPIMENKDGEHEQGGQTSVILGRGVETGSHALVWLIVVALLISNVLSLYALYKSEMLSMEMVFATR